MSVAKKKSTEYNSKALNAVERHLSQQIASEFIEQAMYIQIDEPIEKMKLVRHKNQENSKSPRPRKLASNEAQISDVSDVEPAPNTGQNMLKFNLKFENLEDVLDRFSKTIQNQGSSISEIQTKMVLKSGQKQLGQYFERLSMGVHKEVGDKTHKFKLDDAQFLNEETNSHEGKILKTAIEGFIDKLDIISQAIIRLNKFKAQIQPRVQKLEDNQKDFLSLLEFREELDILNKKMNLDLNAKLEEFRLKQKQIEEACIASRTETQIQIKNLNSEVLWRIKDAEELIKSRVSEQRCTSLIQELKLSLQASLTSDIQKTRSIFEERNTEVNAKIDNEKNFCYVGFSDIKTIVKGQDKKINELASREQIKTLESADKQIKQDLEYELEQMQQFMRELNLKVNDCQVKLKNQETNVRSSQTHTNNPNSSFNSKQQHDLEDSISKLGKQIDKIEHEMRDLQRYQKNYVTQVDFHREIQDKITLQQMQDALPDFQLFEQKLMSFFQTGSEEYQEKVNTQLKSIDARIVNIRKEFDMDTLLKMVIKKADGEQVNADLKNHEFKISLLDKNLIHMASDFQLFQTAMNTVNSQINELIEANKDVLIGRRRLGCLSCGGDENKVQQVVGQDGHIYSHGNKRDEIGLTSTIKYGMTSHNTHNTHATTTLRDSLVVESGNKTGSNPFSYRDTTYRENEKQFQHVRVSSTRNNPKGITNIMKKQKLPFGFMVQQDKKELLKTNKNLSGNLEVIQLLDTKKVRPETAKVMNNHSRRIAELQYEINEGI